MIAFIKENKWLILLSFIIPSLLMGVGLAALGIYWGSGTSILAGDAYHQYVAIHSLYSNTLHHNSGFLYTFTSGLGLNLYAFSAYYMGSFFMPLTFFFNAQNMPDAMYLITLLKVGTMGLTAFISFSNMYKKVRPSFILGLSTAYALMSFVGSQIEIIMWLDVFILLPLILWGLHSLQDLGKRKLYFISLTLLFIQNYYFGFMIALFLVLYFFVRSTFSDWSWRKFFDFAITSALSGMTSLIMLLPMYLDLKANNSNALSHIGGLFTDNSKPLDLLAKNFIGVYDTTQFHAIPMIYIGLVPLVLALLFFFTRSIQWYSKFAFLLLLGILIASFYLQPLDLFWQGMHSPNMFLHRYSFLFSLLIIIMALEAVSRFNELKIWHFIIVFLLFAAGFTATFIVGHYGYVQLINILLTLLFLLSYFFFALVKKRKWVGSKTVLLLISIFMISEAGINDYYQLLGLQNQWRFAGRDYYNTQASFIDPLAKKVNLLTGSDLVRTENTYADTANDGMKYNYNSISQFSSVRNSNSSLVMQNLGFHTDATFLNLRYAGNTLPLDSIFGVKYNINQNQPSKYGFNPAWFNTAPIPNLYENKNAQSIGIFVPEQYKDAKLADLSLSDTKATIQNQTNFLNALTHSSQTYFQQFYTTSEHTDDAITGVAGYITLTSKAENTGVSVTYTLTTPAHSQAYITVPNVIYGNSNSHATNVTVNGQTYWMNSDDVGQFFNLGYYEQPTKIKVILSFPQNNQVSFDTTSFWSLDTQAYQEAMSQLKSNPVQTQTIKNGAKMTYQAKETGQMFLTIPYDKGWTAQIDGKPVNIQPAQNGFMKVDAPAGNHTLTLNFFPQGLKIGIVAFISGILLFIFYDLLTRKKYRKKA